MEKEILQTTDERFLLSAMQHRDLKAYGVLFRRYYPILYIRHSVCRTERCRRDRARRDAMVVGEPGNTNLRNITEPISVQNRLPSCN